LEDRILIVDDEQAICQMLAQRLVKEGYSCTIANNGKEALNYFYKETFSLIISDIRMPLMDGIELLKRVKSMNPNVLVIMITGYPEIDETVEALRFGAYDFIVKPTNLDWMNQTVKNALEKKRLEDQLEAYHDHLERLVENRTAKLKQSYRILKKTHLDSVKVLVGAIEAKDPFTHGHSDRVKIMSLEIASLLGFSEDRIENLEYGAFLHDIGMIGIRDDVLRKPDALSPEEYKHIQEHTLVGVKILEGIDFFKDKIPMIRSHHEHYEGSGYPDGLIGEAIPLEARIISVVDAFDAMTSVRPHREAIPLEAVLTELERQKATQFDPEIVEIFINNKIYIPSSFIPAAKSGEIGLLKSDRRLDK
jgi:response regulator RpfG family c-di-GMP phosphodiesterase